MKVKGAKGLDARTTRPEKNHSSASFRITVCGAPLVFT